MFVTFDEVKYPIVKVKFTGVVRNDNDFSQFTHKWLELYKRNAKYEAIAMEISVMITFKLPTRIPNAIPGFST